MPDTEEVIQLRNAIESLHQDCEDLANFIMAARTEIAQIRPNDLKQEKLPRAGKELNAIVEATETATNQIMSAAEKIMSAKVTDADVVSDACMEIFEACSFQDITGQRISKVVSTLNYIEEYLARLTKAWGHHTDSAEESMIVPGRDHDAELLNGPALYGEGVNQAEIDTLFDETGTGSQKSPSAPAKADKSTHNRAQEEIDALFD